jgi:hypothetical protein
MTHGTMDRDDGLLKKTRCEDDGMKHCRRFVLRRFVFQQARAAAGPIFRP